MRLFEKIFTLITPFECLNCGVEGRLLCNLCKSHLKAVPSRCYRCLRVSSGSLTCTKCRKASAITSLYVCSVYEGLSKELVWRLKYLSARSASKEVAESIHRILPCMGKELVIVPIPTTAVRVRRRGYDQAKLIAKELSIITGHRYLDCISRSGKVHQVGASRANRKKQVEGVFRVRRSGDLVGLHVLLVDDVLTTGATFEAAARVVRKSGVSRVDGVVFAQA